MKNEFCIEKNCTFAHIYELAATRETALWKQGEGLKRV
jgi:hypothetical protein